MFDALIIGGSFGGLAAALQLARARRRVSVLDGGAPRNRFSPAAHGVFGHDGAAPAELLERGRAQLAAYPTASFERKLAIGVRPEAGQFVVELEDGSSRRAHGLVIATGVVDELPELPGLAERWGKSVLHCPYCHGYEIGGGSIGILGSGPLSVHQASLVADWGDATLFLNDVVDLDDEARALLARRRVSIEPGRVIALEGDAPALTGVRLEGGRLVAVRALFAGFPTRPASPIAERLGCEFEHTPLGPVLKVDAWKQTSVPGVYGAGDAAHAPHSITFATATGVMAGIGLHQSLIARGLAAGG